jgi:hypothetical protein
MISPGLNLADFDSSHSKHDPERSTSLVAINLKSCGYARLPYTNFDQTDIEPVHLPFQKNPLFTKKAANLSPAMLSAKWLLLGEIVQEVHPDEVVALNTVWDIVTGWKDEWEAAGPEFDGLLPGGTGRISGTVGPRVVLEGNEQI